MSDMLMSIITMATAFLVLASAVVTFLARKHVKRAEEQVREIHIIVNSQRTEMEAQLRQLKNL